MKYAFIDYENLNSLDGLELQKYNRIFLFIGASSNQTEIHLSEKFNDELQITLITVKDIAKNNVDFHIAYYLGKLDVTVDKNVEFHIFSKDKGYDGVCSFIQQQKNSRVCVRHTPIIEEIKPNESITIEEEPIKQAFNEYVNFMAGINVTNLPSKLESLRNNIHNKTCLKALDKSKEIQKIQKVVNLLISAGLIKIENNKVIYLNSIEYKSDSRKILIEQAFLQYQSYMTKTELKHYPNNLLTLRNNVYNQTDLKSLDWEEAEKLVIKIINKLRNAKVLNFNMENNKVTYL
ncbi:PIN domain-containing protein [Glaesserella sp.]|uniref:PIN domain-containing protein n=1 Tax=Glaesserella sp. TaxID=2094731 RepID=UPI0035A0B4A4